MNNNYVPVDFVVLDIECNAACPIILGRPFLRTAGAIIDMRDGIIRYQFPLKRGMEHFPIKRRIHLMTLFIGQLMVLMNHLLRLAQRR